MRLRLLTALAGLALLGPARAADPVPPPLPNVTKVFCVADLVVPIPGYTRPATETPNFPHVVPFGQPSATANGEKLVKIVTEMVRPYTWSAMGGAGKLSYHDVGYALVVNQTPEVLKEVGDLIEALRRLQDVSVCCEVRVLTGPVGFATAAGLTPTAEAFLTEQQVRNLIAASQANRQVEVRQYPKVTMFNGQTATVKCCDQQSFVTGVEAVRVNGTVVMAPKNTTADVGDTITLCGRLSADRKYVNLRANLTRAGVAGPVEMVPVVTQVTPVFEGGSQGVPVPFTQYVQAPELKTLSVEKAAVVPDGGTVVLGCWKESACGDTPAVVRKVVVGQAMKGAPTLTPAPAVARESVAIATVRVRRGGECGPVLAQPCPAPAAWAPAPACPPTTCPTPPMMPQSVAAVPAQPTVLVPMTSVVYKLRNTAAADVAQALMSQCVGAKVTAEPASNTLYVSAASDQVQQIGKLVEKLDQAPPLVVVDMMVVRVPADFLQKSGVRKKSDAYGEHWAFTERECQMFNAMLQQAKQDGTMAVLSHPQMQLTDNQTGFCHVGGQYPVTVSPADGAPAQTDYRPIGLAARVTPRIAPDGKVLLRIEASYTTPTPQPINLGGEKTAFAFNVESVNAKVILADGATALVSAGTHTREVRHEIRPPVVSNIPYIERLFTNVGYSTEKTELLVLVTPRVVKTAPVVPKPVAVAPVLPVVPPPMMVAPVAMARPLPVAPPVMVERVVALPLTAAAPALPAPPVAVWTTRPVAPVCCTAVGSPCDAAAALVKAYHVACAAGDRDAATRCAVQALAIDPTCFAPKK